MITNELHALFVVARLVTQSTRIGIICDIGSSKRIKMSDYVSEGVPFFRSKEIIELSEGRTPSLELFIKSEQYEKLNKRFSSPQAGDILLTSVGTLGVPYYVERDQLPFYFKDGNLTWMKNFTDKINSKWLYYWLISKLGQDNILAYSIGSTQKAITIDALKKIELEIPSRKEQDKAVEILDNFSDKLRNNRHSNQSLKDIIQALFRSWFIDFEPVKSKVECKLPYGMDEETAALFPDSFEDSEIGPIPSGWNVGKLNDIANTKMGQSPPGESYCTPSEGIPMVNGAADFSDTEIRANQGTTKPTKICEHGDFVYCIRATVGNLRIADREYCIGRGAAFSREKKANDRWFVYQTIQNLFRIWEWESTGSVMINVSSTQIRDSIVLIPPILIREKFSHMAQHLFEQMENSIKAQIVLSNTRDALLPRLMSGELSVL